MCKGDTDLTPHYLQRSKYSTDTFLDPFLLQPFNWLEQGQVL